MSDDQRRDDAINSMQGQITALSTTLRAMESRIGRLEKKVDGTYDPLSEPGSQAPRT